MPKKIKNPQVNLFRLFSFSTTMVFLLLLARLARANAEEFVLNADGSTYSSNQFNTDDIEAHSFARVQDYIQQAEVITYDSAVNSKSCQITAGAPKSAHLFKTSLGFEINIPTPSEKLARLIKKVPVFYSGPASDLQKKTDAELIRKLLPAVGNHQMLAKVVAHPNFKFLISYDKDLPSIGGGGVSHKTMTLGLVAKNVMVDPGALLNFLRNEFASLNMQVINQCQLGYYQDNLPIASPFLFYKDQSGKPQKNLSQKPVGDDQLNLFNSVQTRFNHFMQTEQKYLAMNEGKLRKTSAYKALMSVIDGFVPRHKTKIMTKGTPDWILSPKNKRADAKENTYDVYAVSLPDGRELLIHILPGSYKKISPRQVQIDYYEADPRTRYGKLQELYRTLDRYEHMALNGGASPYARKPQLEKVAEFYSFLEELPPELLNHLFPEYCDYLTRYTDLDQSDRSYCAP